MSKGDAMQTQEPMINIETPLTIDQRRAFLRLPLEERRKLLAIQAEQLVVYYESASNQTQREDWQGCNNDYS